MPREPRPIQLGSRPVPANDSLRLNKDQQTFPFRPTPPQGHPEQLVACRESRLRMLSLENGQLLPKSQVLQSRL